MTISASSNEQVSILIWYIFYHHGGYVVQANSF